MPDDLSASLAAAPWSTFTFVDRHLATLSLLIGHDACPMRIALLGSGPVEPFTVAAIAPLGSVIEAFDVREDLLEIGSGLTSSHGYPVEKLATTSQDNLEIDGPNAWFGSGRLQEGIENVNRVAVAGEWLTPTQGRLAFMCDSNTQVRLTRRDVLLDTVDLRDYDVVWAGQLVINLRKVHAAQLVDEFVVQLLTADKVGIGSSLSPAVGIGWDIRMLAAHRRPPAAISVENLVWNGRQTYGDLSMIFYPTSQGQDFEARGPLRSIDLRLADAFEVAAKDWSAPLRLDDFLVSWIHNDMNDTVQLCYAKIEVQRLRAVGEVHINPIQRSAP